MVEEDDIRKTVTECMQGRVGIANDMIYAIVRQYQQETSVSTIQARDITESYKTDELQTKTTCKRMSYLLRHGALSESVKITLQGYITLADMVLWLNKKMDRQPSITKHHIGHILAMDNRARFTM